VWQVASGKWQDLGKGNIEHPTSNIEHRMPEKDGCVRGSTPSLAFAFLRSSAFASLPPSLRYGAARRRDKLRFNPRPSQRRENVAGKALKRVVRERFVRNPFFLCFLRSLL
jgi:hypothetical protein